jgi:hypothetical protein
MAQQTSVEWLENELSDNLKSIIINNDYELMEKLFKQAKEMHKAEMHECASFWRGKENDIEKPMFKEYYNENFKTITMTQQEALEILKIHQEWRLGANIKMLHPKLLTNAINTILNNFEERYTKQEFLDAAKLGEVSMIDAKHIVSLLDEVREKNK